MRKGSASGAAHGEHAPVSWAKISLADLGCVSVAKSVKAAALSRLVQRLLMGSEPATEIAAAAQPAESADGAIFVVDEPLAATSHFFAAPTSPLRIIAGTWPAESRTPKAPSQTAFDLASGRGPSENRWAHGLPVARRRRRWWREMDLNQRYLSPY